MTATGFLIGSRSARPLTSDEVALLQRTFARCYGGEPSSWTYERDERGARFARHHAELPSRIFEGYQFGPWVSDTLLALLALPESAQLPSDNAVLAAYGCATRPLDNTRTARQGITRLGRLHGRALDGAGEWVMRSLSPPLEPALDRSFLSLDRAAEALRHTLRKALVQIAKAHEKRLPSGRAPEVALELSGGLDSTLIAALARDVFPSLRCVTVDASDEGQHLDRGWAVRAADRLGLPIDVVSRRALRAMDLRSDFESTAPRLLPGLNAERGLSKHLTREFGVNLVLTGHGADGLFALTPAEVQRQQQQWGVLDWTLQLSKMARQRGGVPSFQWLRRHFSARDARDRWSRVGPWYARELEPELRASVERLYAFSQASAWENYWYGEFFPALEAQQHPGSTGHPLWHAHPFLSPDAVALTRQIPAWPNFDNKAVVRRALEQEGLFAHALRPKETATLDHALTGAHQPAGAKTFAELAESYLHTPAIFEQSWIDPDALRHALQNWPNYPRLLRESLPYTLGVLHWEAQR